MPLPRRPDNPDAPALCLLPCGGPASERIQPVRVGDTGPASYQAPSTSAHVDLEPVQRELVELRRQMAELVAGQAEMMMSINKVHDGVSAAWGTGGALGAHSQGNVNDKGIWANGDITVNQTQEKKVIMDNLDVAPTRSSADKITSNKSTHEEMQALDMILRTAEAQEAEQFLTKSFKEDKGLYAYYRKKYVERTKEQTETAVDSVMGGIIFANAIWIGITMDHDGGGRFNAFFWVNLCFTVIFVGEVTWKCWMHGICGHFCGPSWKSNCFDCSLITIDFTETCITIIFPDAAASMGDAPSASLFRVVRLIKLTRLIRLLRSDVFKDLMSMVQGMLGGVQTLVWAMVLFFLIVYVIALLFREMLGRKTPEDNIDKQEIYFLFNSVPRSMYTTFRCAFGDCSTVGGMPLFEQVHLADGYGAIFSMFYCFFVFAMTVGLFNVISAIFVESTMAAAMSLTQAKQQERLQDAKRWGTNMNMLIQRIMDVSPDYTIPGKMSESLSMIHKCTVNRQTIDEVVKDSDAINALNNLDINPEDHKYLSDILDPDNTGQIPIPDFVDGIRRLRGEPRRSDIVSVDLMIRSIQTSLDVMGQKISAVYELSYPDELVTE